MIPEEDFETWRLVVTTVTDDIPSFGEVLPDVKRLMKSISETNSLPGELSQFTNDFIEETFPTLVDSLLNSLLQSNFEDDNQDDSEILIDFFKSAIQLCTSQINIDFPIDDTCQSSISIKLIQILVKILDKTDLNINTAKNAKALIQSLLYFFIDDLSGIQICYGEIENINNQISQIPFNTGNNSQINADDTKYDELLEKKSSKVTLLFNLLQKVINVTTLKANLDIANDSNQVEIEKQKIEKYYSQIQALLNKSMPVYQKIAEANLRKFDINQLDPVFEILTKYHEINFPISEEDDFPLIYNLFDPSLFPILIIFLKSEFFDKHLYTLKKFSLLCTTIDNHYINQDTKNPNQKLTVTFIQKDVYFHFIMTNFESIKSLHFNKEFGEPLGAIYAFLMKNDSNDKKAVNLEFLASLWKCNKFVHAAETSSFYRIFEKVAMVMNEDESDQLTAFVTDSDDALNLGLLEFLNELSQIFQNRRFKAPFQKIRCVFWDVCFGGESSPDLREYAQKKLPNLCVFCSNEIVDQIVKEKLATETEDVDKFAMKMLFVCFNRSEEIKTDLCKSVVSFCVEHLQSKDALDVLTKICQTQKVSLDKSQISRLSNVSNKFLTNILSSSQFDDEEKESFFLSAENINYDLFEMIVGYIDGKNDQWKANSIDYLMYLPFEKEDLLWTFALKKSSVQKKFVKRLVEIYSNNDGTSLTDVQMINTFLRKIANVIDDPSKRESCFLLLKKFVKVVDKTNPNLSNIKKHDTNFESDFIEVQINGIERKFFFSQNSIALVAYYEASQSLNVPLNRLTLVYQASPLPVKQKMKIFKRLRSTVFDPRIGDAKPEKYQHLRSISPLILICQSGLMDKLMSLLMDDNENNDYDLNSILSDLPTFEPIQAIFSHFNIMKKIDFSRLFPMNHPKFFMYSLNCLKQTEKSLKEEFDRKKGIDYFINALTTSTSLLLICEIIDYLWNNLSSNDLIEKYSDSLFEALMRIVICVPGVDQDKFLRIMRKLKPKNIPQFDPKYEFKFVEKEEIEKEEKDKVLSDELIYYDGLIDEYIGERMKNRQDREFIPSEMDSFEQQQDIERFVMERESIRKLMNEDRMNFLMKRHQQLQQQQQFGTDKKDRFVHVDNEIPFSHVISTFIAMMISNEKIEVDEKLVISQDRNMSFLRRIAKDVLAKLTIQAEYFESYFPYLKPSNCDNFLDAFSPHTNPPTDTTIQFVIDHLDVQSNLLDFAVNFSILIIDKIENESQKKKIFDFIFENIFTLERSAAITDSIFKSALTIAAKAPSDLIVQKITEIGIPEFEKYDVIAEDFKTDQNPTGLKNLGCTCYFNSILQQFFYCPSFRKTLIEYKGDDVLFKEIGALFRQMKDGKLKYASPQSVINNWTCWDGEKLNPRIQQDASEFTIMLIDKFETLIPNSMFNGKLLFQIEGINNEEGKFHSERTEPFSVLILPIDKLYTIEDCLEAFSRPSFFTDKNQYYSDTLKRKIDAKQTDFVEKLPDHLILQLKRFEYDYSAGVRRKINTQVSISEEIDVSSICKRDTNDQNELNVKETLNKDELNKKEYIDNDELNKNESIDNDESNTKESGDNDVRNKNDFVGFCTKFHLAGVIQHAGSAMGGHYYSFVKDRATKNWYKCNDENVSLVSLPEVIESANGFDSNAYLLFYDRDDVDEVDNSSTSEQEEALVRKETKINASYNFYMSMPFTNFLNAISSIEDLQELAIKLVLKIIPHENIELDKEYFIQLKTRMEKDTELCERIQNEITDFKFLILNRTYSSNYIVYSRIMEPLFSHFVQQRLIQLAIDTFDYAIENLPNSFYFFRVMILIVSTAIRQKGELLKDEAKNREKIDALKKSLDFICQKTTYILTRGIHDYAEKNNISYKAANQMINTSPIIKLYNIYEEIPESYIDLIKDPEFLKSFFFSKVPSTSVLMKNYLRVRDLKIFDPTEMLVTFFEKESYHLPFDDLLESVISYFGKDSFQLFPRLKMNCPNQLPPSSDLSICYPMMTDSDYVKEFMFENLDKWMPDIIMHDARLINTSSYSSSILDNRLLYGRKLSLAPDGFDEEMAFLDSDKAYEKERMIFNLIKCLFGCLKEMKELILKDDFSSCFAFPIEKYRATQVLMLTHSFVKQFNRIHKFFEIENYDELIDFGEFIVKGHSHPFDPHVNLVLGILKGRCSEEILINSIPSKEVMLSAGNLRKIPKDRLTSYLKKLSKIVDMKLKEGFVFSMDFFSKFFLLIVFNTKNLNSLIQTSDLSFFIGKMLKPICQICSEIFIGFLDDNFQLCINNGFISCIIGLTYLQLQRPISPYIRSANFGHLPITSPKFIRDVIVANGESDEVPLFDDISVLAKSLCNKGGETEKVYNNCREVIWDYLIKSTKMRIGECSAEERPNLREVLFKQFSGNYDFKYVNLIFEEGEKKKEIRSITQFLLLFEVDGSSYDEVVLNRLTYFSKSSFDALKTAFHVLAEKVPQKLTDEAFLSDVFANEVVSENIEIAEKMRKIGFEGKSGSQIATILKSSGIAGRLIRDLKIMNIVYENGIIESRFGKEDEEQLSLLIFPFRLIVAYRENLGSFAGDDERGQIEELSASFLRKLKDCGVNCQTKDEVIDVISQFISQSS